MKPDYKMYENVAFITQIGVMMIVPIFMSIWFGNLIDQWLNTGSIFLLVFTVLGVGAAFVNFYKFAMRKVNNADQEGRSKNTNNQNK